MAASVSDRRRRPVVAGRELGRRSERARHQQPGERVLARGAARRGEAEVGERGRGGHPPAGRAHEQAPLDEERLVDVLDGLGLLARR